MSEHRFLQPVDPMIEPCSCGLCERYDAMMVQLESNVSRPVDALLAAGWMPDDIVALVKTGSPTSSRASMLVRIEIVRRVPMWLEDRSMGPHISQAWRLAKRTGFRFGAAHRGWLEQWFWERNRGDIQTMRRFVGHVDVATAPVLELVAGSQARVGDVDGGATEHHATNATLHRRRPRTGQTRGVFVPEPCDPRWSA